MTIQFTQWLDLNAEDYQIYRVADRNKKPQDNNNNHKNRREQTQNRNT